jgi:hypothetical protein
MISFFCLIKTVSSYLELSICFPFSASKITVEKEKVFLKTKRIRFLRPTKAAAAHAAEEQNHGESGYFNINGCGSFGHSNLHKTNS